MALYMDLLNQGYLNKPYGVVSNTANSDCDNFHLFTAEAMSTAGWVLWPQYVQFYKGCEVEPGLIVRYPHREDGGISQDEMIGAATLDSQAAERIYEYGQKHFWYFNPDKVSTTWYKPTTWWPLWFYRFLDFKPYIKQCAGHKLNIFQQLTWSIMTALSPLSEVGNTSGKLLKHVQFRAMEGHYWICDRAIQFWRWKMGQKYSGGMKQVMQIYFGAAHPLTQYSRGDFK